LEISEDLEQEFQLREVALVGMGRNGNQADVQNLLARVNDPLFPEVLGRAIVVGISGRKQGQNAIDSRLKSLGRDRSLPRLTREAVFSNCNVDNKYLTEIALDTKDDNEIRGDAARAIIASTHGSISDESLIEIMVKGCDPGPFGYSPMIVLLEWTRDNGKTEAARARALEAIHELGTFQRNP
jgi:hypothetical protein